MKISIGNDHAGPQLKAEIVKMLREQGHDVINFGTDTTDSVDYPDHAHAVMQSLTTGETELSILICGTGNGICMTANKYSGVRAALCWRPEIAILARQHNDANVLCLPARFLEIEDALNIVEVFLETEFEGGRHQNRINKINPNI
jgi:ribose 5-phosphate isomerase B